MKRAKESPVLGIDTVPFSLRFNRTALDESKALAESRGWRRSDIVRVALDEYLRRHRSEIVTIQEQAAS